MIEIPNFRPADRITNPKLFELARHRWPGAAITSEALKDIAVLTNTPLYVVASTENVSAGLSEVRRERQRAEQRVAEDRDLRRAMERYPLPSTMKE